MPSSGSGDASGSQTSATPVPSGSSFYRAGTASTVAVDARAPAPPARDVSVDFDAQAGASISQTRVSVSGHHFKPGSTVAIYVHSTPVQLGATTVDGAGDFTDTVSLPAGLPAGAHHVVVSGVMVSGQAVAAAVAFTVATGGVLGTVGSIPPGPLADDVAFAPASHPHAVLGATAGGVATLGAVSAGLAGGRTPAGGGRSGGSSSASGGYLEDVELEREEWEPEDLGDRSRSWRWPGTRRLDRLSVHGPRRLAALSPVAGRVAVDGDYLRAMLGSLWLVLCAAALGLGIYAAASTGWYAVPPALPIFLAVLGVGIMDSTLGYLAGIGFFASALVCGHITSTAEIRLAAGVVLVWFAVPLAAAALRPLRRRIRLDAATLWDRAADLVIGGLFGAWAAEKMTGALSGLAGVVLPVNHDVNAVALAALAFLAVRLAVESFAAHAYPGRLARVSHQGELESPNLQVGLSLIVQIALFVFIALPFMGWTWALWVGTAIFFSPLVPWLFADRIPKSDFITKWKPRNLVNWTLIILASAGLTKLLSVLIHSQRLLVQIGFFVLSLPVVGSWALELFEKEEDEEEEEEEQEDGAEDSVPVHDFSERTGHGAPAPGRLGGGGVALLEAPQVLAGSVTHDGHHDVLWEPSAKSKAVEAEDRRQEAAQPAGTNRRAWLIRLAGVPLVAVSVFLVVAHLVGG